MDWLSFISSLVWPGVALTGLFMFRRNLHEWFKERPDKLEAGPIKAQWSKTVEKIAENLESDSLTAAPDDERKALTSESATAPPESLALELRELARTAPQAAIISGWAELEAELLNHLRQLDVMPPAKWRPPTSSQIIRAAISAGQLPDWAASVLESMRSLRNIAAHSRHGTISTADAFEFLAMADAILVAIRRRANEQQEPFED
ncbi:hypothetical protein [Nocardia nova]|uniref:hypothetical protein n=1 Tax=Nocardia nova TaxID=37330 RepID=UPI0011B05615